MPKKNPLYDSPSPPVLVSVSLAIENLQTLHEWQVLLLDELSLLLSCLLDTIAMLPASQGDVAKVVSSVVKDRRVLPPDEWRAIMVLCPDHPTKRIASAAQFAEITALHVIAGDHSSAMKALRQGCFEVGAAHGALKSVRHLAQKNASKRNTFHHSKQAKARQYWDEEIKTNRPGLTVERAAAEILEKGVQIEFSTARRWVEIFRAEDKITAVRKANWDKFREEAPELFRRLELSV